MAPRKKVEQVEQASVVETPPLQDAGAALYFDRSGPARGVPLSEGKDNFAAITSHAQSVK